MCVWLERKEREELREQRQVGARLRDSGTVRSCDGAHVLGVRTRRVGNVCTGAAACVARYGGCDLTTYARPDSSDPLTSGCIAKPGQHPAWEYPSGDFPRWASIRHIARQDAAI